MTKTRKYPADHAAHVQQSIEDVFGEKKRRRFACWKREVWDIVDGLPMLRAAATVRRIADDSFEAGELTRRGRDAAYAWADRLEWRVKPG